MSYLTQSDMRLSKQRDRGRNSISRTSEYLSANQIELLIGAWRYASNIGLPLNRHITIHFGMNGIADESAAGVISAFLKIINDRCKKAGHEFAATWVRENGEHKGSHVHIFAHIADEFLPLLIRSQCGWLNKASGKKMRGGSLRGKIVRGYGSNDALMRRNSQNIVNYLLKQSTLVKKSRFGITKADVGSAIIGKRCGTTQNIGRKAWTKSLGV